MDLLTLTLIVVASASVYYYYRRKLSYFEDRGVPYEPGLPIFGNMASIIFRVKDISKMVCEIYKAHPDAKYVGFFNFGQPAIILRDPELIKMVSIKNFDHFQNHSIGVSEDVDPLMGGNLFHIKGKRWREDRSLLSPAFTSSKLKSMFRLMTVCSENLNDYLSKLSDEERAEVATKDLFTKVTTDVIAICALGVNVNSFENPHNDFYVLGTKNVILQGFIMFKFYMASILPWVMKLLNVRVIDKSVARFFKNTVSSVIETREKQGIRRPDMIQLLMDARNSGTVPGLSIDAITAHAFGFFLGGFDTTSTQMSIIAQELSINPHIQEKLQIEIDEVRRQSNGKPTYDAINDMPYLDAVFNESIRRHTEAVILDRVCEKPFELPPALPGGKPFVIEPGMMVWISGRSIHLDPKYYSDPKKFNPERYFRRKITINDELNLGFGIGPRACIAYRFGILATKVVFFHLLAEFNLVADEEKSTLAIDCENSVNLKSKGGFCMAIKRRNKNDA